MQPSYRKQLIQLLSTFIVQVIVLYIMTQLMSGFQAELLRSLLAITVVIAVAPYQNSLAGVDGVATAAAALVTPGRRLMLFFWSGFYYFADLLFGTIFTQVYAHHFGYLQQANAMTGIPTNSQLEKL